MEVFSIGHAMDPETLGIWMWIVPEKFKVWAFLIPRYMHARYRVRVCKWHHCRREREVSQVLRKTFSPVPDCYFVNNGAQSETI